MGQREGSCWSLVTNCRRLGLASREYVGLGIGVVWMRMKGGKEK